MQISKIPLPFSPFYNDEYNNQRRLKAIMFSNLLSKCEEFDIPYLEQINIIKLLENSCSNEAIRKSRSLNLRCDWDNVQFVNIYHSVCFTIFSVLDQENNTLIKKIFDKSIDINDIAKLSAKELSPERYNSLSEQIDKRMGITQNIRYSEMHFCYKCKRNKTTAERVQNRSGDEGSSFYITCLFCGTKWFK
jgi:DNA-directed RNA polymerase subunit M/transcription elongation factor TFIIS